MLSSEFLAKNEILPEIFHHQLLLRKLHLLQHNAQSFAALHVDGYLLPYLILVLKIYKTRHRRPEREGVKPSPAMIKIIIKALYGH